MRVDAPPSVASSDHSRLAAVTGAGACGTVPLGGIGATPGGDEDDVSCTDEEEAPGTSTALRACRGRTAARRSALMAGGCAGSGNGAPAGLADGNGPAGGGTAGGGARAVAATTRIGAAGGPGDDTRAPAIGGDHGGLLPRAGGSDPDSHPQATGFVPARPAPS